MNFVGNEKFPNYELYYYYEGRLEKNVNNLVLNGAPVIFVPGNAGSYKQVRNEDLIIYYLSMKLFTKQLINKFY